MKNKKILIISIIVAIITVIVIACAIGGFLFYKISKKNEKEYNEAIKRYERLEKVSEQVNDKIDKEILKVNEFIATNPDVRRR